MYHGWCHGCAAHAGSVCQLLALAHDQHVGVLSTCKRPAACFFRDCYMSRLLHLLGSFELHTVLGGHCTRGVPFGCDGWVQSLIEHFDRGGGKVASRSKPKGVSPKYGCVGVVLSTIVPQ